MPLKLVRRKNKAGEPLSPYWYIRGSVHGQEVFESTGEVRKGPADAARARREHELLRRDGLRAHAPSFLDAATAYLQHGGETRYIEQVTRALAEVPLTDINQGTVDATAAALYPRAGPATRIRQVYTPIIAVMNRAAAMGLCARPLIRKPKLPPPRADYCELPYLKALWAACRAGGHDRLRALLIFLPYTGCRISEALGLTWARTNLSEGYAFIPKTKNGRPRTAELPAVVTQALAEIRPEGARPGDRVFGYHTASGVAHVLRRVCARGGLPYVRTHVIGSHTYATWLRRYAGLDSVGLTMTGRWTDPRSTQRYAHAHTSEAARKAHTLPGATPDDSQVKPAQKPVHERSNN